MAPTASLPQTLTPYHAKYYTYELTETELLMIETKARKDLDDPEVAAKRQAAEEWCVHASAHAATYGGKPWRYALVPHDVLAENMSLSGLLARYE